VSFLDSVKELARWPSSTCFTGPRKVGVSEDAHLHAVWDIGSALIRVVIGGSGFILSAAILMIEVQKKWWKPNPTDIGWQSKCSDSPGSSPPVYSMHPNDGTVSSV
jgi:hypothetical protein